MTHHEDALQLRDKEFDAAVRAERFVGGVKDGVDRRKFTKRRVQLILEVLSRGGTKKLALLAAGIRAEVFATWREDIEGFQSEVDAAESAAYGFVMDKLTWNIDKGNIAAVIFWLKNRHPDEWQDKPLVRDSELVPQLTIEFPDGKRVTLDAKRLAKGEEETELRRSEYKYEVPPVVVDAKLLGGDK